MQLGEAGGANNLAIGGENLHEDSRRGVIGSLACSLLIQRAVSLEPLLQDASAMGPNASQLVPESTLMDSTISTVCRCVQTHPWNVLLSYCENLQQARHAEGCKRPAGAHAEAAARHYSRPEAIANGIPHDN